MSPQARQSKTCAWSLTPGAVISGAMQPTLLFAHLLVTLAAHRARMITGLHQLMSMSLLTLISHMPMDRVRRVNM